MGRIRNVASNPGRSRSTECKSKAGIEGIHKQVRAKIQAGGLPAQALMI